MRRDRILGSCLAALSVLGLAACEPSYEGISVRRVAGSYDAEISGSEMSVPEGAVVVFEPELQADRGDYDALDVIDFQPHDRDVARVVPGLRAGTWMLLGASRGETELDVFVNDQLEDTIPVRVVLLEEDSP